MKKILLSTSIIILSISFAHSQFGGTSSILNYPSISGSYLNSNFSSGLILTGIDEFNCYHYGRVELEFTEMLDGQKNYTFYDLYTEIEVFIYGKNSSSGSPIYITTIGFDLDNYTYSNSTYSYITELFPISESYDYY